MSEPKKKISEEEKLSILREFYASGKGINEFIRTCGYDFLEKSMFWRWRKKFESENKELSLQSLLTEEQMARRSKEQLIQDNEALTKQVKDLKKALEFARLETKARDIMIDIAEERFDIPIRKKAGAKQ